MKYLKSIGWALGLIAATQLSFALEVENPANISVKYCADTDCSFSKNDSGVNAVSVAGGNPVPLNGACEITIASSGAVQLNHSCNNNNQFNTNSQQWQQNNEPEFRR